MTLSRILSSTSVLVSAVGALRADSADPVSPTSVVVMWNDTSASETSFRIERATGDGPFETVYTAPADTDVWTDTGLRAATTYTYRVTPLLAADPGTTGPARAVTTLAVGDSVARMRQNALNYWRAIGASRKSARMSAALANLDTLAHAAFSTLKADGSWADITYTDLAPGSNWTPRFHYERLQSMARAWATPGAVLHQNPALLAGILKCIDFIETKINPATSLSGGNWWWWQIGVPLNYGPALVLMRDQLGSARIASAAATLDHLIGTAPRQAAEGIQNRVWVATERLYHGMLADSSTSLQTAATTLSDQVVLAVPGAEGLMPDFSFQAHGTMISGQWVAQLATGHYGVGYLADLHAFIFFAEGTSFQISAEKQALIADFALKSSSWVVWGEYKDISSEGRAYTRDDSTAIEIMNGLLALANTPDSPARPAAAATAKAMLAYWSRPLTPENAGFAAKVEASAVVAALPTGFQVYQNADYAIFRPGSALVSLKTASTRTLIGERVNLENKRGRHLASGVTWITTGSEYRTANVIPTLDHARLPGTTVEHGVSLTDTETWHYQPGLRTFVGAVTTGTSGVAAMDFQSRAKDGDSHLTAKKSWFFFADSFVALGSGITSSVAQAVETTVNQRPLSALAADIIVNGKLLGTSPANRVTLADTSWVHAADIGYVFPVPATVQLKRQNQTGKWSDLGVGDSTATHETPMFTLWFDHGRQPADASYAYAVLPGRTAAQTQTVAAAAPYRILAQTAAVHAVKHTGENAVGAVFWQAGWIDKVSVNAPCIVAWRQTGVSVQIALAEPTHAERTITLTYDARLTPVSLPPGVTAAPSPARTVITFNVEAGRSYVATFQL